MHVKKNIKRIFFCVLFFQFLWSYGASDINNQHSLLLALPDDIKKHKAFSNCFDFCEHYFTEKRFNDNSLLLALQLHQFTQPLEYIRFHFDVIAKYRLNFVSFDSKEAFQSAFLYFFKLEPSKDSKIEWRAIADNLKNHFQQRYLYPTIITNNEDEADQKISSWGAWANNYWNNIGGGTYMLVNIPYVEEQHPLNEYVIIEFSNFPHTSYNRTCLMPKKIFNQVNMCAKFFDGLKIFVKSKRDDSIWDDLEYCVVLPMLNSSKCYIFFNKANNALSLPKPSNVKIGFVTSIITFLNRLIEHMYRFFRTRTSLNKNASLYKYISVQKIDGMGSRYWQKESFS